MTERETDDHMREVAQMRRVFEMIIVRAAEQKLEWKKLSGNKSISTEKYELVVDRYLVLRMANPSEASLPANCRTEIGDQVELTSLAVSEVIYIFKNEYDHILKMEAQAVAPGRTNTSLN